MFRRTFIILAIIAIGLVPIVLGIILMRRSDSENGNLDLAGVGGSQQRDVATVTPENRVEVIAEGLNIPWDLAFLPDGAILLTERPGAVRYISPDNALLPEPIADIPGVEHIGEGGLLGITLHPEFNADTSTGSSYVYLYYTYRSGNNILNRISRYIFISDDTGISLEEDIVILENIPGSTNHNGGRIRFGPDRFLYITTGDAGDTSLPQDINSLAGKILRLDADGNAPEDNPFGNSVYSYGHRNPQGLAWDEQGRLWATEHGPTARDELNLIEPGDNYGWPIIIGDQTQEGMIQPVIHSGSQTWAPSGLTYTDGSLFFAGLRGNTLYEVRVPDSINGTVTNRTHLVGEFGRLRAAIASPSGFLYLITNNRDGRGSPRGDDDRLIVINPMRL